MSKSTIEIFLHIIHKRLVQVQHLVFPSFSICSSRALAGQTDKFQRRRRYFGWTNLVMTCLYSFFRKKGASPSPPPRTTDVEDGMQLNRFTVFYLSLNFNFSLLYFGARIYWANSFLSRSGYTIWANWYLSRL